MLGELLGHYRIVSKVGEGGMGVVYRARDEVLHRDIAIKVLSSRTVAEKSAKEFLLEEARAASALSHPNICTIHQVGEAAGELYIVMELIEGEPLSRLIAKGSLPVESVLHYGVQVARALGHSHGRNIVHRDLKSSNVMVTEEGLVKVLDFGLARRLRSGMFDQSARTLDSLGTGSETLVESTGGLTGTLPYMSPEVLHGEEADHRSDLWALGVVLYEAASGQLPFRGRTAFETSSAILRELPEPLPSWIPGGLAAIVQRCLAKEPQQRYQRARAADDRTSRNPPPGRKGRRRSPARGHDEGSLSARRPGGEVPLGSRRAILPRAGHLFLGLRRACREASPVGVDVHLLGNVLALQRRFRKDVDESAGSQCQISAGLRNLAQEYLADLPRPAERTRDPVLRRGARGPF
jgi:serine/threonine protein kinase